MAAAASKKRSASKRPHKADPSEPPKTRRPVLIPRRGEVAMPPTPPGLSICSVPVRLDTFPTLPTLDVLTADVSVLYSAPFKMYIRDHFDVIWKTWGYRTRADSDHQHYELKLHGSVRICYDCCTPVSDMMMRPLQQLSTGSMAFSSDFIKTVYTDAVCASAGCTPRVLAHFPCSFLQEAGVIDAVLQLANYTDARARNPGYNTKTMAAISAAARAFLFMAAGRRGDEESLLATCLSPQTTYESQSYINYLYPPPKDTSFW